MGLKIDNTAGERVIDPYNHKDRFLKKRDNLSDFPDGSKDIIRRFLYDMSMGRNVSGNKGARSYTRLNTLRSRLKRVAQFLARYYNTTLHEATEDQIVDLFMKLRTGEIKKTDGGLYKAVADYAKIYKSFWHWYMKTQKKTGKLLPDITEDLDTSREKAKFNYFTIEQLKLLADNSKYEYKVMMYFLFDTGIRAPTEFLNVKRKDLIYDQNRRTYSLNIRDETSKTFGRKIKLLLSSQILKTYIEHNNFEPDDFIFQKTAPAINKTLRKKGRDLLKLDNLTMYDFRHSSACYWVNRYPTESALKYRFGWKRSNMIHYYTEFMGMKDNISEEDLIDADEKHAMQKQMEEQQQRLLLMEEQLKQIQALTLKEAMKEANERLKQTQ